MSESRRKLESWLKTIDVKGKSVIDIGGISLPVKNRTQYGIGTYQILDIKVERKGVKADYIVDLNEKITNLPKFDVGFCLEVMQFLYNPLMALKNMRQMCSTLYINFHLYHIPCKPGTDYLRYTEQGVERLLTEAGFKIEEMIPREGELGIEGWFIKAI